MVQPRMMPKEFSFHMQHHKTLMDEAILILKFESGSLRSDVPSVTQEIALQKGVAMPAMSSGHPLLYLTPNSQPIDASMPILFFPNCDMAISIELASAVLRLSISLPLR